MPVLPSLYRHLSSADKNLNAKVLVNSFFAKKQGSKTMESEKRPTDPSTLKGYEELDDLESQWGRKIPMKSARAPSAVAQRNR